MVFALALVVALALAAVLALALALALGLAVALAHAGPPLGKPRAPSRTACYGQAVAGAPNQSQVLGPAPEHGPALQVSLI